MIDFERRRGSEMIRIDFMMGVRSMFLIKKCNVIVIELVEEIMDLM